MDHNDKARETMRTINSQFGKGSVMRLGDDEVVKVKTTPTALPGLSPILGVGGWPQGRIIDILSCELDVLRRVALGAIGGVQSMEGREIAAYVDSSHQLDIGQARAMGVKAADLLVSQPDCLEQTLEIAEKLVTSGAVKLVVVDSPSTDMLRAVLEGEELHHGLQARLASQAMRRLAGACYRCECSVMFLSQGDVKTTVNFALRFYASLRVEFRPTQGGTICRVAKNKMASPFKTVSLDL